MAFMDRLSQVLLDKYVVPPIPQGRVVFGPDAEPDDETDLGVVDEESASTSCYIEYTDSKGQDSARVITFRSISGHYGQPETIGAHCHLRNRYKNFSVGAIRSMVCAATGEELDPVEHCLALHRYGALKIEDKALARVMRIVTFMARCDGDFHQLEQAAIDDVLGRYFRFFGGDDVAYECARREAVRLAPSGEDVVTAVKFISKAPMGPELAKFVIKASAAVIDADGVHHPDEVDWGVELGARLRTIAERGA